VGRLGACNTIGSIIGTFLPTFVTIPAVGTAVTFLIFSGVLLVLALIYFFSAKRGKLFCIISVILFIIASVLGSGASFAFWDKDISYEGESIYNYLQVKEDDREVALSTNVLFGVQSVYVKDYGLTGYYYDYAMAAPFMAEILKKEDPNVLVLGMGCGTYATQLGRMFPEIKVEGVEIDQSITDLSREYFELPEEVEVTTYDGRAYLEAIEDKYDVIMVDAYQDITIPFQMSSKEFFSLVSKHLEDDGVMVVNLNMRSDADGNINEWLCDTIAEVFPEVVTVDVAGNTNRELFAAKSGDLNEKLEQGLGYISDGGYFDQIKSVDPDRTALIEAQVEMLSYLSDNDRFLTYDGGSLVFTDDKAPVELLGMRVIDSLIADEVAYYKGIFEQYGIEGLLDQI
ncbi:MAG: fused MFS/spermidine synthase, partial [Lachnospiraceae bacterium]|nr:fused MFS/spermidine synthase [Lachnospiraceae bacterium]